MTTETEFFSWGGGRPCDWEMATPPDEDDPAATRATAARISPGDEFTRSYCDGTRLRAALTWRWSRPPAGLHWTHLSVFWLLRLSLRIEQAG